DAAPPTSWEFRTGADGAGRRCGDDPYTPDELWIRAAYQDVLGRTADAAGLETWTYGRDRGVSTGRLASNLVGSLESRGHLADRLYLEVLGRPAEPEGRTYWAERLRTEGPDAVRAYLFNRHESTSRFDDSEGFVAGLYDILLGRPASEAEVDYWSTELSYGRISRGNATKRLLASPEGLSRHVGAVYEDLLGRDPGAGEIDYWMSRVKVHGERYLVRQVIASAEYYARSQED
ncbi:MAG TPA: DUF4214 domain-containing protein, partial [Iamia sp.]|nr:DUF4214 domain-containing protein [Iamia sp.]